MEVGEDMAPVEEDGHTDSTESAGGAPTIPEEEISRKNSQNLLERQSISVKRVFTTDINTLRVKMKSYEKEFPTDSTPQSERQLEDAKDIVDILASAGGEPTMLPEEEISRKNRQTALEHQGKSVKRKFTTGKNTLEKLMLTYENEFPTDDSKNVKQLKDAKEIVSRYGLLNDRYKNIVNIQQEIMNCICTSMYLEDEEVERELAKAEAPIKKYLIIHTKFKEDFGKIVDKAYNCIRFNTETNTKYPTNNSENCKNHTVTHSNTSTIKEIEEYSEEKDDETEKENSESEESNETEKESEENEDGGEQTDEDDKVKCKVDYDMKGHEDITVTCRYFKKSHKNVRIPDTDCREKLRSPQEMVTHVKQDHPWYIVTLELANQLFEENKEMEKYELEYEDNSTSEKADNDTSDANEIKTHKVLENLLAKKQTMTKIENNQIEASNKETTKDVPPVHIAAVPPPDAPPVHRELLLTTTTTSYWIKSGSTLTLNKATASVCYSLCQAFFLNTQKIP